MEKWKNNLRATMARNISGLRHLTERQQAALLESEFQQAVEATEAACPFGQSAESEQLSNDDVKGGRAGT